MAIYLKNGVEATPGIFGRTDQYEKRKTALFGIGVFEQQKGEGRSNASYGPYHGYALGAYAKFAFNSVYLPPHVSDPDYYKRVFDHPDKLTVALNVLRIFFGYEYIAAIESTGLRYGVGVLYTLMLGPVFMFLLNTATLFTEFLPKLASEMLGFLKDKIRNGFYPNEDGSPQRADHFKKMPGLAQVAYGVVRFFEVFFETLFVLGRMITSPMNSFFAGLNSNYVGLGKGSKVLGIFSLVGSLTIYTALFLLAGPLLALAGVKMGFSFVPMSHFSLANAVAEPVMTLLTHLGLTASANLLGAVATAVLGTLVCFAQGGARLGIGAGVSVSDKKPSQAQSDPGSDPEEECGIPNCYS